MLKFIHNNLLQQIRVMLLTIVTNYNFIHTNIEQHEFDMIASQIREIDMELVVLLEQYTWLEYGSYIFSWQIVLSAVLSKQQVYCVGKSDLFTPCPEVFKQYNVA